VNHRQVLHNQALQVRYRHQALQVRYRHQALQVRYRHQVHLHHVHRLLRQAQAHHQ